ncbi:Cyclic di-GMP phosphodiesterase response regulator RpfG [Phycisphaerae bacterium RAS1]|nr:Cyclic di-GMP phosphodiesterase response regulator RpfG [Phycisphaerae bacterium RAS1]
MSAFEAAGFHAAAMDELVEELNPGRVRAIQRENEDLGRELLRCYEQLSLVFEITEHIANLQDPDAIRDVLLRRYAGMLTAAEVFVCAGDGCNSIEMPAAAAASRRALSAEAVRECLRDEVEAVRSTRRVRVPPVEKTRSILGERPVLLAALRQADAETSVVIALREPGQPPFDSSDMLAAESVLGYGGYILTNILMVRSLQQTAIETVRALVNTIDAKDNYTSGHSQRVGWLARMTGEALGLPRGQLQMLEWAGLLHDVGKIGVPEHILNKPGRLTPEEFEEMKKHPRLGYDVLKPVSRFEPVLGAVLYHHENQDGSGYPEGLRGDQIPLPARIIHVVDIFDALTSTRSYRPSFGVQKAFDILREGRGTVTEPTVTDAFLAWFDAYRREQAEDFALRFAHCVDGAPAAGAPAAEGAA